MGTIKTFPKGAFDEMHRTVPRTTRDETDLLADYYQLSRKIAEREVREIFQAQSRGPSHSGQAAQTQGVQPQAVQPPAAPQEDDQAKADREELRKLSKTLAEARKPASTVGRRITASLPGWCFARQEAHSCPLPSVTATSICRSAGLRGASRPARRKCLSGLHKTGGSWLSSTKGT